MQDRLEYAVRHAVVGLIMVLIYCARDICDYNCGEVGF